MMIPTNVLGDTGADFLASFLRKLEKYPSQTTVRGAKYSLAFVSFSVAATPPMGTPSPSTHSPPSTFSSFFTVACFTVTFGQPSAASRSRITNRPL